MRFAVELSDEALEDLARYDAISPCLSHVIDQQLKVLAEDPCRLSKPSTFPYWPCQAYKFSHVLDGRKYLFTALFKFGADEQTLHILGIAKLDRLADDES
jgi:hypothetical protein